jgi:hypothetical protein
MQEYTISPKGVRVVDQTAERCTLAMKVSTEYAPLLPILLHCSSCAKKPFGLFEIDQSKHVYYTSP